MARLMNRGHFARRTIAALTLTAAVGALTLGGALGLRETAQAQGTSSISVTVNAEPDDAQDFDFTAVGPGVADFVLDDDADPALPNVQIFEELESDRYVIAGPVLTNRTLTSLTCDGASAPVAARDSAVGAAVVIDLLEEDHVNCVFNYQRTAPDMGSLRVVKRVVNDDSGELGAADFNIHVMQGGLDVAGSPAAGSETGTAYQLLPGDYAVSEDVAPGYRPTLSGDCAEDGSVTVVANAEVMREIVNDDTAMGSITITKRARPANGTDFEFVGPDGSSFMLDDDDDDTLPSSMTFEDLPAGSYSVTELGTDGWRLEDVICTSAPPVSRLAPSPETVDIELADGAHIECTFVNVRVGTASLTIVKEAGGNEGSETSFETTGGLSNDEGFALDDDPATDLPNRWTFDNLPAGPYSVAEMVPQGWILDAIACRGGGTDSDLASARVAVELIDDANVTCTFINREIDAAGTATISVTKDAGDLEGSAVTFVTTGGLDGDAGFVLDDDAATLTPDTHMFEGVEDGEYTVTEEPAAGWKLDDIVCTGGETTVDVASATVSVSVEDGDEVSCTFINSVVEPGTGTITIVKVAEPADGTDFTFTATGLPQPSFMLDVDDDATLADTMVFDDVPAGLYSVGEEVVEGWTLTDIICTNNEPPASRALPENTIDIEIADGVDIVCTFYNAKDDEPAPGSLTIIKDAGDAAGSLVTFTTTGGLGGDLGFSLDDDVATAIGDTQVFNDLVAGTYSVTEGEAAGWLLQGIVCDDAEAVVDLPTGTVTVTVEDGEDVLCTFTNVPESTTVQTAGSDAVQSDGVQTLIDILLSIFRPIGLFSAFVE